nr:hypothetical protein [Tanacetum cinerariifolium]
MSIDDLFNNFKIIKQEVKGTACSDSSSQNMAFVTFPSANSTNKVSTAYGVSTASSQSSTANTKVSTANLIDATVYVFLSNQSNRYQLVHEDLKQIHEDDLEEMDLKWQLAILSKREKRSRRTVNVEETPPKAMVAIDGVGFDWSYMAEDEVPTNMAVMAFSDSEGVKSLIKVERVWGLKVNVVPPPPTGLFLPPQIDLSYSGLEEFQQLNFESYGPKSCKTESKNARENILNELKESTKVKESSDVPLVKKLVSDDKLEKKRVVPIDARIEFIKAKQ